MLMTVLRNLCLFFLLAGLVTGGLYTPENLLGLLEREDVRERSWTASANDVPEDKDQIPFPATATKTNAGPSPVSGYGAMRRNAAVLAIKMPLHEAPRGPPART